MVTKKTKRGEKEMDLKPLVYELRICPEGDGEMEGPRLFMKISAGSAAKVKPEQVLDALVEQWQRTPADVVLFPPGTFGDELSTRLAWKAGIHSFISLEQR